MVQAPPEEVALIVKTMQILMDDGWRFIVNETNNIESAHNESMGEEIYFENAIHLKDWLYEQSLTN